MQDSGTQVRDSTVLSLETDFISLLRQTHVSFFATFLTLRWLVQVHHNLGSVLMFWLRAPGQYKAQMPKTAKTHIGLLAPALALRSSVLSLCLGNCTANPIFASATLPS